MTEIPPLQEITVEITQQCLQKCVHCSSVATIKSQKTLTKDEIIRIAQDFANLGGKTMELSGGEPLLHDEIFNLIPILKSLKIRVNVFTCGKITDSNDFARILKEKAVVLKRQGVNKVVLSVHGANSQTHNDIARSQNSFSHAVTFIQELVKENLPVGIHFVPMSPNFEEFKDLVEFAVRIGVKEISVLRFVPQGRGEENKESLMLDKEAAARLIELLTESEKRKDIRIKIGSHLDFTFLLDGAPPKKCMAGIRKCLVEPNGDVIPCAVFKGMKDKENNNYVAGNVRETSLDTIWRTSSLFKKFRTFDPKSLKGECATCQYLSPCRGRCPAQRVYDYKDLFQGPDSYCPKELFQRRTSCAGDTQ